MTIRVALFARSPVRRQVKNRLAEVIGEDTALNCYLDLLQIALRATAPFATTVWYEGSLDVWRQFGSLNLKQQSAGDLGQKMLHVLLSGDQLLVGSDIPLISEHYIKHAGALLDNHDLVVGPTEDGGYCLIGMKQPEPLLFQDIPWSTNKVLSRTLEVAHTLNLKIGVLNQLWDVDDVEDYGRWIAFQSNR